MEYRSAVYFVHALHDLECQSLDKLESSCAFRFACHQWRTVTPLKPNKVPAGASYENFNLYLDMGTKAPERFVSVTDFTIEENTLTIHWSALGFDETTSNKFVLRAVTDGVESADAKITIKFSTLKTRA